jgi:hypothetical protein
MKKEFKKCVKLDKCTLILHIILIILILGTIYFGINSLSGESKTKVDCYDEYDNKIVNQICELNIDLEIYQVLFGLTVFCLLTVGFIYVISGFKGAWFE